MYVFEAPQSRKGIWVIGFKIVARALFQKLFRLELLANMAEAIALGLNTRGVTLTTINIGSLFVKKRHKSRRMVNRELQGRARLEMRTRNTIEIQGCIRRCTDILHQHMQDAKAVRSISPHHWWRHRNYVEQLLRKMQFLKNISVISENQFCKKIIEDFYYIIHLGES